MSAATNTPRQAQIRLATEADIAAIHALIAELARATGMAHKVKSRPADFLRFGFRDRPAFQALVAEDGARLTGLSLFLYNFSSWRGELGVYVQDLVVADGQRGSGLGRRLMAETARIARQRGATHLRLSVDKDNRRAIAFYRKLGLVRSDEECILQAEGAAFLHLAGDP